MGFLRNAPRLNGLIERLESAEGLEDLQLLIEELRDEYGVDHIVYHWVNSAGEQYGCGTYDLEWVNHYIEKGYLRIDPVIQGCYQRFHPVNWKRLDWSSKSARAFLEDAIAHGIGNQGYSIPIRGPNGQFALFSMSHTCNDDEWEAFTTGNRRDLILVAHSFNSKPQARCDEHDACGGPGAQPRCDRDLTKGASRLLRASTHAQGCHPGD